MSLGIIMQKYRKNCATFVKNFKVGVSLKVMSRLLKAISQSQP